MPLFMKKIYQYFYAAFIVFVFGMLLFLPIIFKEVDIKIINLIFSLGVLIVLSSMLILFEIKIGLFKIFWAIFYYLISLGPILLYFVNYKYLYLILMAVSLPALLINLSLKERADYTFNVKEISFLSLVYLISLVIGSLIFFMSQDYWILGFVFYFIALFINFFAYKVLKSVFIQNENRFYFSIVMTILIAICSYFANVNIEPGNINLIRNILLPVISLLGCVALFLVNNLELTLFIKEGSTE